MIRNFADQACESGQDVVRVVDEPKEKSGPPQRDHKQRLGLPELLLLGPPHGHHLLSRLHLQPRLGVS